MSSPPTKPWPKFIGVSGTTTLGFAGNRDPFGSILATGYTDGNLDHQKLLGMEDSFITKYDEEGNKLWTRLLGGGPKSYVTGSTVGYFVASDSEGNVFGTGITVANLDAQSLNGYQDAYLVKYDPDGNKEWTRLIGGGSNTDFQHGTSSGRGIVSDALGNIYIAGTTNADTFYGEANLGENDYFLAKYDPNGNQVWVRMSRNSQPDHERFTGGLTIDSNSDLYLVGATDTDFDGQILVGIEDALIVKYDKDGNKLWSRLVGVSGQLSVAHDIGVDPDRNIYAIGSTSGELDGQTPIGQTDMFIIKYDKDGNKLWTRLFGNPAFSSFFSSETLGQGITVDSNGNSYIAGMVSGTKIFFTNAIQNSFIAKFDTNGNLIWSNLEYLQDSTKCLANAQNPILGLNNAFFVTGYTLCNLDFVNPSLGVDSLFISKEELGTGIYP
ncbi:SBBP repeat-containing protein [Leptospira langatensis]|nr:SBBP repeat-containing protein [Leptospira langatensis]